MKQVKDMMIDETIGLIHCSSGDRVRIACSARGMSWVGHVIVVKVKSIPGNKLQLKYHKQYGASADKKILKIDLPRDVKVQRTRKATGDDTVVVNPKPKLILTR